MNSTERVTRTILGKDTDRTPIYGWVSANLTNEITAAYGSVAAFEDKYEYDMAHIFAGPHAFNSDLIEGIRKANDELTPDLLLDRDIFLTPDNPDAYKGLTAALDFHKKRGRFCYIQTPGFFEQYNSIFGIQKKCRIMEFHP